MESDQQLDEVIKSVDTGAGTLDELRYLLQTMRPQEIANLLESTPPKVRQVVWDLAGRRYAGAGAAIPRRRRAHNFWNR